MASNGWHVKTAKVKHQNEDNTLILLFLHACYVLCIKFTTFKYVTDQNI